jgi:hypothetical protein
MQEGGHISQVGLFFGASELDGAPRLVTVRVDNPKAFRERWESMKTTRELRWRLREGAAHLSCPTHGASRGRKPLASLQGNQLRRCQHRAQVLQVVWPPFKPSARAKQRQSDR